MSTTSASISFDIPSRAARPRRAEIFICLLLLSAIAAIFWSQQRYPALLKRLHAGHGVQVKGAISFDALLPVKPEMPLAQRVERTSVNWMYTNRFGMYFAIPFGAVMMALMSQFQRPARLRSAAGNVLCGAVAGAPMGVCSNCATPMAQSLLAAGASARLTVAGLISSPSFNPIVVAMAFVLFPLPLALLRLAVPAALLLVLPWLVDETEPKPVGFQMDSAVPEPLAARMQKLALAILRDLVRVTLMTLPWMLLAAVTGALAAEAIPAYGTHLHVSAWAILPVAVLGTLLPVPMALDVALAFVLYRAGAPAPLVAALLCTLGPISIFSLSALAKQLGLRVAIQIGTAVAVFGTFAGLLVMALGI